jgi:hypothetical protein
MQASSVELDDCLPSLATTTSVGSDLGFRGVCALGYPVRGSLVKMSFAGALCPWNGGRGEYFHLETCFAREVSPQPR